MASSTTSTAIRRDEKLIMGRYNFSAQRVHAATAQLLAAKRITTPPPWYNIVGTFPPSARLDRPPLQRPQRAGRKASRMFTPLPLQYQEDELRWEYFNDHPWELARPRVILEDDGRDRERRDWSVPLDHSLERPLSGSVNGQGERMDLAWDATAKRVAGRPLDGEAVVQRQAYLMSTGVQRDSAYDTARKELYRLRHAREIETRVAREEALAVGAFFGLGPLEIGMQLEDVQYEEWRRWAIRETQAVKQLQESAYTGLEEQLDALDVPEPEGTGAAEGSESSAATSQEQGARGGRAIQI